MLFTHSVSSSYDPKDCSMPDFPVLHCLPEFAQTHVHWVSDAIKPSYPLSPPSPPTLNLSQNQGFFQWVDSSHQLAKVYWSFGFSISPSNEYSGFISFRIDWLDLLAVQETLNSKYSRECYWFNVHAFCFKITWSVRIPSLSSYPDRWGQDWISTSRRLVEVTTSSLFPSVETTRLHILVCLEAK